MGILSWHQKRKHNEIKHRTNIFEEERLPHEIVWKLRVLFINSHGKDSIYLVVPRKRSKIINQGYYDNDNDGEYFEWIAYKDIFTEEKVCDVRLNCQSMTPGVEYLKDEDFKEYLLQYNEAHDEYSFGLLKKILQRIKNDNVKNDNIKFKR